MAFDGRLLGRHPCPGLASVLSTVAPFKRQKAIIPLVSGAPFLLPRHLPRMDGLGQIDDIEVA
jgi:hypothetical protein